MAPNGVLANSAGRSLISRKLGNLMDFHCIPLGIGLPVRNCEHSSVKLLQLLSNT